MSDGAFSLIETTALKRWAESVGMPVPMAQEILEHAQGQVQEAMGGNVHPLHAAQVFLACLAACFEGCSMPPKQRREFMNDFYRLIEPVVAERAQSWLPSKDGTNVIVTH